MLSHYLLNTNNGHIMTNQQASSERVSSEDLLELTQEEFDQKVKDRLDRAEKAAEKKFKQYVKERLNLKADDMRMVSVSVMEM